MEAEDLTDTPAGNVSTAVNARRLRKKREVTRRESVTAN